MASNPTKINGNVRNDIKWSLRFVKLTFLFVICLSVLSVYLFFLDGTVFRVPVTYWEGSFTVEARPQGYRPGDEIWMRVVTTKRRDLPSFVTWSLVSETGLAMHFQARRPSVGVGYHDVKVPVLQIPEYTPSGRYHLEGYVSYDVSPFRSIVYQTRSNSFDIVSGNGTPSGG